MNELMPPGWMTRLFRSFCDPKLVEIFEGDLYEQFQENVNVHGLRKAKRLYLWNIVLFFQPFAIRKRFNSKTTTMDMYWNYLKIGYRNLIRHKSVSTIKIFGLAVGMACALLILLYVQFQFSYNTNQSKGDRIVRLESETWVIMPPYLKETMQAIPEVEEAVRFFFWYEPTLKYEEKVFTIRNFALVDSTVFKVFDFKFLAGSPETAFENPNSIVLTRSTARKLFGDQNPIGESIVVGEPDRFMVSAVIEDVEGIHMEINGLITLQDVVHITGDEDFLTSRNHNFDIYLLLHPNVERTLLTEKINTRAVEVDNYGSDPLIVRDFRDIYFASDLQYEKNTKHGNLNLVISFTAIAILILLIACINFINLTIAKTRTREKEIALRKVTGAIERNLRVQFFTETILVVLLSFVLALILVWSFLPRFSNLVGEPLYLLSTSSIIILILLGVVLFTVLASGLYPAFYLARTKTLNILRGKTGRSLKNSTFNKFLISFQYAISIFLIIATITVVRQLDFMQNKDLGISHDLILTSMVRGDKFRGDSTKVLAAKEAFRTELLKNPNVIGVTFLNQIPGKITNTYGFGVPEDSLFIATKVINTDPYFLDLMKIEIHEGRFFDENIMSDLDRKIILNQEAVKQLELEDPIGSIISQAGRKVEVIGVVKDFHYNSVQNQIEPMVMIWDWWTNRACIKLSGSDLDQAIVDVSDVYQRFSPDVGFDYEFLDQSFARNYYQEKRLKKIISYFVGLAIILSCLGLYALTALVAEQKTKEIGIRKALGSSYRDIILLVTNRFSKSVLLANLVSWPIAYYLLSEWLMTFHYRINLGIGIFLISGLVAFVIAFATMGIQGIKSAMLNPVDSLKYE